MWIPALMASVLLILLDLYVLKGLGVLMGGLSRSMAFGLKCFYVMVSLVSLIGVVYIMINISVIRDENPGLFLFFLSMFWVLFIPKLLFAGIHFLDDVIQLTRWGYKKLMNKEYDASRRLFVSQIGLSLAGLTMGGFLYGVTKGKFNFRVLSEKIYSPNLPSAFEGLRIVQLSDAHLGSFLNNYEPIERMVDMVNALEPDYIFFTGDMVNEHASEAEGWEPVFARLKSKRGKYSVLGNHDYAKYFRGTEEERADSMRRLAEVHRKMGFRLMRDEHEKLVIDGEQISLLGVNNWGPGFGEYGDLDKAMRGVDPGDFKILLSHDPSHFELKVLGKAPVDLTLSGHTHGCQMGIEIPSLGIKWSPVSVRYKRWGGLYQENGQYLYVNRGMGVLALPGRVGMPPEITCLDLHRS